MQEVFMYFYLGHYTATALYYTAVSIALYKMLFIQNNDVHY